MLVSMSPCFCVLCAKFFALLGLGVGASAKKFALHAQNGRKTQFFGLLGEFFAEVPLEGPCWANYFAEGRWKPRVGWVFSRDPALRPGLVGGAAPFMSVAVGVLQH